MQIRDGCVAHKIGAVGRNVAYNIMHEIEQVLGVCTLLGQEHSNIHIGHITILAENTTHTHCQPCMTITQRSTTKLSNICKWYRRPYTYVVYYSIIKRYFEVPLPVKDIDGTCQRTCLLGWSQSPTYCDNSNLLQQNTCIF